MKCRLCGGETDRRDSLYCGFCHAVFHRNCIVDHFYYNRFCPECKRKISFIDLQYGEPPELAQKLAPYEPIFETDLVQQKVVGEPALPVQKTPSYRSVYPVRPEYRYRPKRWSRLRGFISKFEFLPMGTLTRFRKNWKGMLGLYMLAAAIVIAVLAPFLILYDPVVDLAEIEYVDHPPTWKYPLGTDVFGRDIFSQTVWGFRSALIVALPSALLVGIIGTAVGMASGYSSGIVDAILQRISITFLVWPSVPLVALIVFSWGPYQALPAVVLGVSFTLWPTTARAIRAEVLSLKNRPFIEAAKVSGASSARILIRHIFPNVIHITFLYMTIAVASALVLEATFNFLGLTSPSVVTWGQMLSFTYHAARSRFGVGGLIAWWTIVPPGLAIAYMVFSFFLISTGLRESMKASLKQ